MKRNVFYTLLLSISIFFASPALQAVHIVGGEITYSCIGNDSFEVVLKLYRDCTSSPVPSSISLYITAPNCGTNVFPVTRDTAIDITPICQGSTSPCNDPNSPVPIGLEQHVFSGIWGVPSGSPCTQWTVYYNDCCRFGSGSPSSEYLYFATELITDMTLCNNSPVFTNEPVPYICSGFPFYYNPGVVDPDGDSLVFSLAACRTSDTATIFYYPAQDSQQFMVTTVPITVDSITGALTIQPASSQIGLYCIKVEEYRNGVKIGEVTRDMPLIATNCNNVPPQVSGINGGTNYDTAICPGQPVSFDVFSNDSTPFQDVVMSWNEGIPNATFNITGTQYPQGSFSWNTTVNDIGTHFFTVNVMDDGCPMTSQGFYTYTIHVRNPRITLPEALYACNGEPAVLDSSMVNMSVNFVHFSWAPASGIPNNDLYRSFNPGNTTTYTLSATNGTCSTTAQLTVFPKSLDTSVTNVNDTLHANQPNATYQWVDCDSNNAPIAGATGRTFRPSVTGNYAVRIDNDTCSVVSGCYQVIVLGRNKPQATPAFQLFPNPSNGTVHLTVSDIHAPNQRLRIFDLSGREVYAEQLPAKANHTLNLSLPDGLYHVMLESEVGMSVRSMAIVR